MKKDYKRLNQKEFRIEAVIIRKGDKLYIKWKGYDNWGYDIDLDNDFFVCLFVWFFGLILVKKIFFRIYNLLFVNLMNIKIKIY